MNSSTRIRFAFLLSAFVTVPALGQDPFSDRDPFSPGNRSQKIIRPIQITFRVTGPSGAPLQAAQIRGPGITAPLRTQRDGTVVWRTGENQLRRWAKGPEGDLRFHCLPPADAVMPSDSTLISVSELLKTRTLEFQMRAGIRLMGQVVGERDQRPVEGVTVVVRPTGPQATARRQTQTDDRGQWSIVAPRVDVTLTLRGHIDGYDLEDVPNPKLDYAHSVQIRDDVTEMSDLDFRVKQWKPLNIVVTDSAGQPVPGAKVSAYRHQWLDDRIVVRDSLSPSQSTGPDGTCSLLLRDLDGKSAIIVASANQDQLILEGHTALTSEPTDAVRVIIQPYSKLAGVLRRDGSPTDGVDLVLYEAIQKDSGEWTTIGVRGEATTNDRGRYRFEAPVGLRYIIATKQRDQNGVQRILYRTEHRITPEDYPVPNIDL
jgi:hypothetical protein